MPRCSQLSPMIYKSLAKVRHLSRALSPCFRLRQVYAEYFRKILDDVRRKDFGCGSQPHRSQFLTEGLAPVHEGLDTHPGTIRQLLFCHCFHISGNVYWLTLGKRKSTKSISRCFCSSLVLSSNIEDTEMSKCNFLRASSAISTHRRYVLIVKSVWGKSFT